MSLAPIRPPRPFNADGKPRRVGVELEFSGIDCATAAEIVRACLGGTIEPKDRYRYEVKQTSLGDFAIELDARPAHPAKDEGRIGTAVRGALARVASIVMPNELSAPPLPWDQLEVIDDLVDSLRRKGARGTEGSLLHAFGLHFNPEIADTDPAYIRSILRSYLLLEPWLRAGIHVDLARDVAPFIDRFPAGYVALVADPGYRPGLDALIDDYLTWNPTRNRSLDMFPLFAWLDSDRFFARIADPHVRPRPTFHYRLPNSRMGDPGWSIIPDWNRWVRIEQLAEDRKLLDAMGQDYRTRYVERPPEEWLEETYRWLER